MTQNSYVVTSITPNLVQIEVRDIREFATTEDGQFAIGSHLKISDSNGVTVVAVVKSYRIKDPAPLSEEDTSQNKASFVVDAQPVGIIRDGEFRRGGQQIAIPPTDVDVANTDLLRTMYRTSDESTPFEIGSLSINEDIRVPIDGDRFFGKHTAVLGSTGSGKSCTVAKILQESTRASDSQSTAGTLNNSHILVFDIHGEYGSAFPGAKRIDVSTLALPYWLMNGEELEEMFIESNEQNSHNQISQFRHAVVENKKKYNKEVDITYDTPVYFSIVEVFNYICNINSEVISKKEGDGCPKLNNGTLVNVREEHYFSEIQKFIPTNRSDKEKATTGPFSGEFDRFVRRLETKLNDDRLGFLLKAVDSDGEEYRTEDIEQILRSLIGYSSSDEANITLVDLAGVPFEETSIVVSLISRLLFEFSFYLKAMIRNGEDGSKEAPLLVVYEEAHKYVPNSHLAGYVPPSGVRARSAASVRREP